MSVYGMGGRGEFVHTAAYMTPAMLAAPSMSLVAKRSSNRPLPWYTTPRRLAESGRAGVYLRALACMTACAGRWDVVCRPPSVAAADIQQQQQHRQLTQVANFYSRPPCNNGHSHMRGILPQVICPPYSLDKLAPFSAYMVLGVKLLGTLAQLSELLRLASGDCLSQNLYVLCDAGD
jgi:hypothetical protein